MKRTPIAVLSGLLGMLAASVASGHHSFAAEFDRNQQGELSGEITYVGWRNPHVLYRLAVTQPDGSVEEWELKTHNVITLREIGWVEDTLKLGDRVTVAGSLGRGGAKKLSLDTVELPDGTVLNPAGGELASAYRLKEITARAGVDYGIETNDYPVDITGLWDNRYNFVLTVDDLTPKPTPLTEAGRAVFGATQEWQDPAKLCFRAGLPRTFGAPRSMEIVDAGDYYLMVYGSFSRLRRIWMDGRSVPDDVLLSSMGYSRGAWNGRQLTIETTHLLPGWLDGSGLPMSGGDGTRIVETYRVSDDGLTMERRMTIHDDYYTEPLVRIRGSARSEDMQVFEEPQCDPTDHIRALSEQGHLESLFDR